MPTAILDHENVLKIATLLESRADLSQLPQMNLFSCVKQLSKLNRVLLLTLLSKYVSEAIASDFSNGVRSFGAVKCLFVSENLENQ